MAAEHLASLNFLVGYWVSRVWTQGRLCARAHMLPWLRAACDRTVCLVACAFSSQWLTWWKKRFERLPTTVLTRTPPRMLHTLQVQVLLSAGIVSISQVLQPAWQQLLRQHPPALICAALEGLHQQGRKLVWEAAAAVKALQHMLSDLTGGAAAGSITDDPGRDDEGRLFKVRCMRARVRAA